MQSLLLNVDVLRRGEHFRHEAEQLCNNEQPSERGEWIWHGNDTEKHPAMRSSAYVHDLTVIILIILIIFVFIASEDRIRNGCKKIMKSRQGSTQGRLDTFFTVTGSISSKRKVCTAVYFRFDRMSACCCAGWGIFQLLRGGEINKNSLLCVPKLRVGSESFWFPFFM